MKASPNGIGIGTKVVCINDDFTGLEAIYDQLPKAGVTYTVREVSEDGAVLLDGIINARDAAKGERLEPGFYLTRFHRVSA